ncbi:MAG: oxidoreductase [Mogibacterium sp.]|nr:oxidoreductase [Mogibacterium sp.]
MKQTARIISTYSADVMGVSSALFELGGMVVMHDPSGCNSTYTTHDEPRWFDMDSMIYISGLSEMEAIMGDDEKLISDIEEAAAELEPAFIAIAGTPIPTMTGFDFEAVAEVIEQRTGIPTFGFPTSGMNTYIHGASMALAGIAKRFVDIPRVRWKAKAAENVQDGAVQAEDNASGEPYKVNILGLTPLDFSINGTDDSIAGWLESEGFEVVSRWAMGSSLDEIKRSADADVNLVVSAAGIGAAEILYEKYGIPYVIGLPVGETQSYMLCETLLDIATVHAVKRGLRTQDIADQRLTRDEQELLKGWDHLLVISDFDHPAPEGFDDIDDDDFESDPDQPWKEGCVAVIGEGVTSLALADAIEFDIGVYTKVLCATEIPPDILRNKDSMTPDEDDIIPELEDVTAVIADPLYKPIVPDGIRFIPLPSEAFSGRMYRDEIPDIVKDAGAILDRL